MQQEKHSNSGNWKERLEQLTSLPGDESADLENAWAKLEARLHARPAQKSRHWQWAVACLVFSFILSLFLSNERVKIAKSPGLNNTTTIQTTNKTRSARPVTTAVDNAFHPPVAKKQIDVLPEKNKQFITAGIDTIIKNEIPLAQMQQKDTTRTIVKLQLPVELINTVSNASPIKLKVIHNNTLGTSVQYNLPVVQNNKPQIFRLDISENNFKQDQGDYPAESKSGFIKFHFPL